MNASDGRLKAAGEPCRVHAECGVCCLPSGLPGPMRGEPPRRSALSVERSAPSPLIFFCPFSSIRGRKGGQQSRLAGKEALPL